MKRFFYISFFLLSSIIGKTYAQRDLILTGAGVEIRCKILEESPMRFTYAYINEKGKVLRGEIFKTLISTYNFDYYPEDILPKEKLFKQNFKGNPKTVAKAGKPEIIKNTAGQKEAESAHEKTTPVTEAPEIVTIVKDSASKLTESLDFTGQKEVPDNPDTIKTRIKAHDKSILRPEEPILETDVLFAESKEKISDPISAKQPEKINVLNPVLNEKKNDSLANSEKNETAIVTSEEDTKPKSDISDIQSEKKLNPKENSEQKILKSENAIKPVKKPKSEFHNYLKYRVGGKVGLSNLVQENFDKSALGLFREGLLRGWNYGFDMGVFLTDYIGLGLIHHNFTATNRANSLEIILDGKPQKYDLINSEVKHKFLGTSLLLRKPLDYKTLLVGTLSPGYFFYSEKGQLESGRYSEQYIYKGNTWGGSANLGLDFLIGDDIYGRDIIISIECGYVYGNINSLKSGNGEVTEVLENPINLNRLDFSVGLRFTRFPRYFR